MNRAEEFAFAWALLEESSTFLDAASRHELCVRLGAGDYRDSITLLLQHFMDSDMPLPPVLSASLWAWIYGFVGSDYETPLRDLASGIRVSAAIGRPSGERERQTPIRLVPRRNERATRLTLVEPTATPRDPHRGRIAH